MIAVCAVEKYESFGLLRSLVVRKDFRGRGMGGSLIEKVFNDCKNEGFNTLFLLTPTVKGLKKIGWTEIWKYAVPLYF
ncbi:MAG: GNAT family N-acetyltransferase [bacterium]